MLKSKASIRDKFSQSFAIKYSLFESFTSFFRLKIINQQNLRLKNKKILDICCGTGVNSLILAKKGAIVVGVDLSKNQIRQAKKRKKIDQSLKLKFQLMDAEGLAFKKNSFDIVFCSFGLHELGTEKTFNKVISQIKRVLRPKGKLVIIDYNKPENKLLSSFFTRLILIFEPRETTKKVLDISFLQFAKEYCLKPVKEKGYFLDLLKLWIFKNEKL